ncbi:UvrD-helicase domain-containing protein [Heyndrickxia oleronia]|jgi:DNA helicase-2/ATP-dependent DNA helicase PcrA|uniref:UvrD-helicase domain-containing protein n=1 Tax=Heyndrickxia oleronia TaxID=38875 RepID=UPI0024321746|nr:UvrD-helicase domain-containing protein [Heyndrickxia oleronia]MCI1615737.1 UvrD-helicase domain-containing protein [Heyndrickxia oleronia]MCI1746369.1 UvrD-helicase domain-containing protein [Heyndrickxia oleronia]MCI1764059.1 UvrD-helicase domain-containing protein [Heyndrickxia oleronia]
MSLSIISPFNREKEQEILNEIFNSINNSESIIFNSGAGAGKTFALIESMKYVIREYGIHLKKHNQKIVCITYTNVATKEVIERLGNTDLVLVSTIHERIWGLIKDYQKELVEIHKDKLQEEISNIKLKLETDRDYSPFQELEHDQKEYFKEIMIDNKELYYENYYTNAADLRNAFKTHLNHYPNILKNVSKFRKIVNAIYNLEKLTKCCENISLNKSGYNNVEYNSVYNIDKLHKMQISHDTLLDYSLRIIEKYDVLKQIIIDKYPFVFIDEYQDTNDKIIQIMSHLENYAKKIGHKIFIGYFGDTAQSIYENGIGSKITEVHLGLKPINKVFNRRSTKEVITVINRIRNDELKQVSIYDDCEGGDVKFYKGTQNDIKDFIDTYIHKWNINQKNQLHCLVLTNKIVAEFSGFKNIYEVFKNTDKYSGINYNQLNTELFSKDISKLGEIPKLLFNIVKLYNNLEKSLTPVIDISPKVSLFDDMKIEDLRNLIKTLKKVKGKTFGEYIEAISSVYTENNNEDYKKIIDWTLGIENITVPIFENYLTENLFNNKSDDDIVRANSVIHDLLGISMDEFEMWYKFIIDNQEEKVIYHTFHGTKGREFDNVIIIMENAFGRDRNYFNFFFQNFIESEQLAGEDKRKFERIKNLLYVSCSRAIKNLRVLYIDELTNIESGIKEVFGQIFTYNQEN